MNCIVRLFLTAVCLSFCVMPLLSQPPQTPTTTSVAVSTTTGKEAVCEGAGEIIPSVQTFTRKRYLAAYPKPKIKVTKPRPRK